MIMANIGLSLLSRDHGHRQAATLGALLYLEPTRRRNRLTAPRTASMPRPTDRRRRNRSDFFVATVLPSASLYRARVITNRSIPTATVIPVLVYPDVREAVAWLTEVFGFVERVRIGEGHRSQLGIGSDGAVIVADVRGEQRPPQAGSVTHVLKVRVADVDAQFQRARSHGARIEKEPTDYPYGERECTVADLAGHLWQFTQTLRDVAPEEWGGETVTP